MKIKIKRNARAMSPTPTPPPTAVSVAVVRGYYAARTPTKTSDRRVVQTCRSRQSQCVVFASPSPSVRVFTSHRRYAANSGIGRRNNIFIYPQSVRLAAAVRQAVNSLLKKICFFFLH